LQKSASLSNRRVHAGTVFYAGLSLAKRRILNSFHTEATWRSRITGLIRLPFEILTLYSIAIVLWNKSDPFSVRSFYWDSRW
jgi:hypothetical protein